MNFAHGASAIDNLSFENFRIFLPAEYWPAIVETLMLAWVCICPLYKKKRKKKRLVQFVFCCTIYMYVYFTFPSRNSMKIFTR